MNDEKMPAAGINSSSKQNRRSEGYILSGYRKDAPLTKKTMRIINFISVVAVSLVMVSLQVAAQARLKVTVKNIRTSSGSVRVGLFSDEKSFLKKAIQGKVVKASVGEVTVEFENLKPGKYGLSVIHDENENGELDTNMMGLPKEGFAFGNNAMGMFGPPDFEKAKVEVEDRELISQIISLKYL
jgi:uncharacterized protein (DUF2141 family)